MLFQIASGENRGIVHNIPIVVPVAADLIRVRKGKSEFSNDGNNDFFQLPSLALGRMCFRFNIQINVLRETIDQL